MGVPLNLALMRHPANWVIVTLMAMVGALALDLLTKDTADNG